VSRQTYYEDLKNLAQEKRSAYEVNTSAFGLREVRRIYKKESIHLDIWPLPRRLKALYMCSDGAVSVAVQKTLPYEPKLFALVHELKHHYRDQEALASGTIACGDYNANELIEKGAEVFAAEFIYPEQEFANRIRALEITTWAPEQIVRLKRNCGAHVSYMFLCKRLERLHLILPGQFQRVQFRKLEERIYGIPFYRGRKAS
jgi:Zn-dependent peptidase ImmA (M78 family)